MFATIEAMETITGIVDSIVYSDQEKGFTVARLRELQKKELTCIVGLLPSLQPGEQILCHGAWKSHAQHGKQFEVHAFESQMPSDVMGIQKYLESGMIKGIGAVYAEKIVKTFGVNTLEVIDSTPEKLRAISGIGAKRLETIKTCWKQQKSIRDVMIFLRGHGISPAYAQKIYKTYGEQCIQKVKENPYHLAKEVVGIGFKSADKIAMDLGIVQNSPVRLDAGVEYVLWELSNDGHVCSPRAELLAAAKEILGVDQNDLEPRLSYLLKTGDLVEERDLIWLKSLFLSEIGIARELGRLMSSPSALRAVDSRKALIWVQEKLKLELAPEQAEAVALAVAQKVHIITGGPGTGKSTITKAILAISEKLSSKILLAAPTGRAAKRMSEITGKKASTIHGLLEVDFAQGGFKRKKGNPLDCDLLIVDEASMIDTNLMSHLLKAVPSFARLILVGDIDQLPSVGPGNVLKDMISSNKISVSSLKKIFRQAAGSKIVINAHKINSGEFPDCSSSPDSDFFFFKIEDPARIAQEIVSLVTKKLPTHYKLRAMEDIQVLSPMKKGLLGTEALNLTLQDALNPSKIAVARQGQQYRLGDKVMQIVNNHEQLVYNGDIGRIIEIDREDQVLRVRFDDRLIDYEFTDLDELALAYAVSIHKYQGSECPCVVIPMHTSHFKLLTRNLLYTGITRGKKLVVLVGTMKACALAVNNEEVKKRFTGLKDNLIQFL